MASSGERRMLFDTRGKRRHVIQVVYAVLALLMGGSLFLVIGPVNIGELIGNSTPGSSAAEVFDEQVERVERRLAKDPKNEQLLLTLTRAQINAGNSEFEVSETEVPTINAAARKDFEAAAETWSRYLKQAGDDPSASAAQVVAGTFFKLAEAAPGTPAELEENIARAAKAQRIATEQQPTLGALGTLAIYEYFNGNLAAGDKASKQAAAKAPSKAEAKNLEKQLDEYRERAVQFKKNTKQAAKQEQQAGQGALQSPFGLGGAVPGG
jgi:hypothetical protein